MEFFFISLSSLLCFAFITLYFRGGFSFVKTLNVFFGVCAIAVHLRFSLCNLSTVFVFFVFMWFYMFFSISSAIPMGQYYYSLMIYVRNQFMGCTLLMSCIQVKIPARKCDLPLKSSSLHWTWVSNNSAILRSSISLHSTLSLGHGQSSLWSALKTLASSWLS